MRLCFPGHYRIGDNATAQSATAPDRSPKAVNSTMPVRIMRFSIVSAP